MAELYALAVSRPEFLHSVLPTEQIIWLKQQVFHTPIDLTRQIALAPASVQDQFMIRGSRLFTWEQLDALLNELSIQARSQESQLT